MEEKTRLRLIFEASMVKQDSPNTPFSFLKEDSKSDGSSKQKDEEGGGSVLLSELFIKADQEIKKRWPNPVGAKFVRTEQFTENWQEKLLKTLQHTV